MTTGSGITGSGTTASRGLGLAAQIVERLGGEAVADDTEARVGDGVTSGVLEDVPPGVDLVEQRAANLVPEPLSVLNRGDSEVLLVAADGPASLGDPDGLSVGNVLGLADGLVPEVLGVVDAVVHLALEVRVAVEAEPVDGLDDGIVGAVGPRVPGVDVADGGVAEAGAGDGLTDALDVSNELLGLDANAGIGLDTDLRVAVEILTADGDTDDELGEGVTVLVDGRLQGGDLVVHVSTGCPETEQQRCLLGDGGGDGLNGGVAFTLLDGGQTLPLCATAGQRYSRSWCRGGHC